MAERLSYSLTTIIPSMQNIRIWQYDLLETTNKLQPCNRIYYSTVRQRLNVFQAVRRLSSGALTVFAASGLHMNVVTGRSQIQLELLMMSGIPLETFWAFNELWNNKFCYKVASCWLFLLNHTTMHGSMNIKSNLTILTPKVICILYLRKVSFCMDCCVGKRTVFLSGTYGIHEQTLWGKIQMF